MSDGLLAVKKDGKWGFVDMTGAEAVPPVYRDVHPVFEGGYTAVETEDKLWGFIDNTGRVTAEPVFKNVLTPFSEGLAGVLTQDGKAYARPDGSIAFHADYERLYAFKDGLTASRNTWKARPTASPAPRRSASASASAGAGTAAITATGASAGRGCTPAGTARLPR